MASEITCLNAKLRSMRQLPVVLSGKVLTYMYIIYMYVSLSGLSAGYTTFTCATCGGDSVCFVDCSTGRVMKKYKQPGETFYCLAWTTVCLDSDPNKQHKTNLIAAGGSQCTIKIIEPNQLVCFEEIEGHKGVLECLVFHPHHPSWLLSAADDNTIMIWEIGLPKGAEYQGKSKLVIPKCEI